MSKHSDDCEVFFCDCGYVAHMFTVDHFHWGDDIPSELTISIHLNKKPLLKRISVAWHYLLGYQSRFGAFDSVTLDTEDVQRLHDSCKRFLKAEWLRTVPPMEMDDDDPLPEGE